MKYIYIPYDKHKTTTAVPFVSTLLQVGDFTVTSNLDSSKVTKTNNVFQNVISYTLDDIVGTTTSTNPIIQKNVTLNVNRKRFSNWLKYSSVEKNVLLSLDYLYYSFPAALVCYDNINGKKGSNILNAAYNPITNKTSFVINTNFIENPLEINYLNVDLPNREKFATHRTLKDSYGDYWFEVDGQFYAITNFAGSSRFQNSYISLEVEGQPFENGNHSLFCYISPSTPLKNTFIENASEFTLNLIRNEKPDGYYLVFEDEKVTDDGVTLAYELTIIFPKTDKYNLDFSSNKFNTFKQVLLDYAVKQDTEQTNLVLRKFVEPNLLLGDFESFNSVENEGDRLETLLSAFAFGFDEHYKFINALKNVNILTYNGEDNMADELLDLYLDSFGIELPYTTSNAKKKQLGLSLPWLVKNKGTRAAIEFLFQVLDIPLDFINFKEYVKKIESPIDVKLLKSYLTLIYDNSELVNISVDEDGYPQQQPQYIFEDSDYWSQFYVLDANLNGKFQQKIDNITNQTVLYENNFQSSGTTFEYNLYSSSCYVLQSGLVEDTLYETQYDECECEIEEEKQAYQLSIDPVPLYTGCTAPILDIWQECVGVNEVQLHITPYGGIGPYVFYGAQDGDILPPDELFSVYVEDSVGCQSLLATGTTYCYNANCYDNPIVVNLGYQCNLDENQIPNGTATVLLMVSGGTEPYIIHGNENGDILPVGETIAVEVEDALGCTSGIITRLIECATPNECDFVELYSTGECISNVRISDTKINVTYNLDNIPNTTDVDNVVMTITLLSGGTLYGGVVTEVFHSQTGVKTVQVNSTPALGITTLNIDLAITLLNGCIYSDNYNLAVDCVNINTPTEYTNTLT